MRKRVNETGSAHNCTKTARRKPKTMRSTCSLRRRRRSQSRQRAAVPERQRYKKANICKSAHAKNNGRLMLVSSRAARWRAGSTSRDAVSCKSTDAGIALTRCSIRVAATGAAAAGTGATPPTTSNKKKMDRTASGPIPIRIVALAEFTELVEDLLLVRLFSDVMNVDVAYLPLLVDDEDRPFGHPFFSQNAVPFRHGTVRIEIAEKRIRDPSERF